MRDAFLQRVIAQRRLEQRESRITPEMIGGENCDMGAAFAFEDAARRVWLDSQTVARKCQVCGGHVMWKEDDDEEHTPLSVCTACGGRKKQTRLEAEEKRLQEFRERHRQELEAQRAAELAAATKQQRRRDWLLSLAGITPKEKSMEAELSERFCPTSGCGKRLRSDNTKGMCSRCQAGRKLAPVDGTDEQLAGERKGGPRKKSDTMKRFRLVAEAVGDDPDALLEEFADGYLERIKSAARGS